MDNTHLKKLLLGSCLIFFAFTAHASALWTFSAPNPAKVKILPDEETTITYTVTNQSQNTKNLKLKETPGLRAPTCHLATKGSTCSLVLTVKGNQIPDEGIHSGPVLCEMDSQCYGPSENKQLNIISYSVLPDNGVYIGSGKQLMYLYSKNDAVYNVLSEFSSTISSLTYLNRLHRIYIGTENGSLYKCELRQKFGFKHCTIVSKLSSPYGEQSIKTLIYLDGNIYAGQSNGRMWKCSLVGKCQVITTGSSSINSMVYANNNIYVGFENGLLRKCSLIGACQDLDKAPTSIQSIIYVSDHIYVGRKDGIIWKCNVNSKKSCVNLYNAGQNPINSLMIGKNGAVYAGLDNGMLWKCNPKIKDSCEILDHSMSSINVLSSDIDGHIYVGNEQKLQRCHSSNKNSCTDIYSKVDDKYTLVNNIKSLQIGSLLLAASPNEDVKIDYKPKDKIAIPASEIIYYKVVGKNNELYYKKSDTPVTTVDTTGEYPCRDNVQEALYVILPSGEMYVANVSDRSFEVLNYNSEIPTHNGYACTWYTSHAGIALSALINADAKIENLRNYTLSVVGAGTIKVYQGKVEIISNCSGHFKPSDELFKQTMGILNRMGIPGFVPPPYYTYNLEIHGNCLVQKAFDFKLTNS